MINFENIGFSPKLKKAIKHMGYHTATEVQEKSIPLMISGHNVVSKSFTGSGKTAAFGIALSERIISGESCGALVVCPTRELAVQVKEELREINRDTGLIIEAIYGGTKMSRDERIVKKKIDILCATPGRLLDQFEHRRLNPKIFDTVVLDEADRMLDMGFIRDIKHILSFVRPKNTHLFSATLTGSVAQIIERYIPTFKEVIIAEEIVGINILQKKEPYAREDKFAKLLNWIKKAGKDRVLVFVSTKHLSDSINEKLKRDGFKSTTIHGDKKQKARETALKNFKEGRRNILIATDVAARGLQIDNVEFVINFDRARDADTHKHRIGRTGRMGDKGLAITFIPKDDSDKSFWKDPGINYAQGQKRRPSRGGSQNRSGRGFSQNRSGRGFSQNRSGERRSFGPRQAGPHGSGPRRKRGRRSNDVSEFVYRN